LSLNAQVVSLQNNGVEKKSSRAIRPIDVMSNPQTLIKMWIDEPIPLSFYTPKEKEIQKLLNEKTADGIVTYSPLDKEKEWTKVDVEEITPYTWKWIDFELPKPNGTLTKIALRRPHWWLREVDADSVGKKVYLNMPELGSQGWATVKAIRVNQLDTRFWDENRKGDYVSRPITGKFEHESNDVYYLHFGDNPEPLGVTGSHPIWSIDRNDWVGASELKIGEKVKTEEGLTVLKSRTKSDKKQKVYNLEIYKDHNFLVSTDKILVHNSCIDVKDITPAGLNKKFKGQALDPTYSPFKTTVKDGSISFDGMEVGKDYAFVLTNDGSLKIGGLQQSAHYQLAGGASSVRGAGVIRLNASGQITYINNSSGHYTPSLSTGNQGWNALQRSGLIAPGATNGNLDLPTDY
jgi:Pretoxin HINT domain